MASAASAIDDLLGDICAPHNPYVDDGDEAMDVGEGRVGEVDAVPEMALGTDIPLGQGIGPLPNNLITVNTNKLLDMIYKLKKLHELMRNRIGRRIVQVESWMVARSPVGVE